MWGKMQRKRNRRKVHLVGVSVISAALVLTWLLAVAQTEDGYGLIARIRAGIGILRMKGPPVGSAQTVFREYVLDPIPPSVMDIRVDRTHAFLGYGYTLRFRISQTDLTSILNSQPFKELAEMEYHAQSTSLTWKLNPAPRTSLLVYAPGQRRPIWFKPEDLNSPVSYAVPEGGWNIRVLIYDPQIEEAYLIIRRS